MSRCSRPSPTTCAPRRGPAHAQLPCPRRARRHLLGSMRAREPPGPRGLLLTPAPCYNHLPLNPSAQVVIGFITQDGAPAEVGRHHNLGAAKHLRLEVFYTPPGGPEARVHDDMQPYTQAKKAHFRGALPARSRAPRAPPTIALRCTRDRQPPAYAALRTPRSCPLSTALPPPPYPLGRPRGAHARGGALPAGCDCLSAGRAAP